MKIFKEFRCLHPVILPAYPFPEKSKRKALIPSFPNETARFTITLYSWRWKNMSCKTFPHKEAKLQLMLIYFIKLIHI